MAKSVVGYCPRCREETEHIKIQCDDTAIERTFFAVVTMGFSELLGHEWKCKCRNCGRINTIEV